jgi:hypothetical protein
LPEAAGEPLPKRGEKLGSEKMEKCFLPALFYLGDEIPKVPISHLPGGIGLAQYVPCQDRIWNN